MELSHFSEQSDVIELNSRPISVPVDRPSGREVMSNLPHRPAGAGVELGAGSTLIGLKPIWDSTQHASGSGAETLLAGEHQAGLNPSRFDQNHSLVISAFRRLRS